MHRDRGERVAPRSEVTLMLARLRVPARHRYLTLRAAAERRHHVQRINAQAALAVRHVQAALGADERVGDASPGAAAGGVIFGMLVARAEDQRPWRLPGGGDHRG